MRGSAIEACLKEIAQRDGVPGINPPIFILNPESSMLLPAGVNLAMQIYKNMKDIYVKQMQQQGGVDGVLGEIKKYIKERFPGQIFDTYPQPKPNLTNELDLFQTAYCALTLPTYSPPSYSNPFHPDTPDTEKNMQGVPLTELAALIWLAITDRERGVSLFIKDQYTKGSDAFITLSQDNFIHVLAETRRAHNHEGAADSIEDLCSCVPGTFGRLMLSGLQYSDLSLLDSRHGKYQKIVLILADILVEKLNRSDQYTKNAFYQYAEAQLELVETPEEIDSTFVQQLIKNLKQDMQSLASDIVKKFSLESACETPVKNLIDFCVQGLELKPGDCNVLITVPLYRRLIATCSAALSKVDLEKKMMAWQFREDVFLIAITLTVIEQFARNALMVPPVNPVAYWKGLLEEISKIAQTLYDEGRAFLMAHGESVSITWDSKNSTKLLGELLQQITALDQKTSESTLQRVKSIVQRIDRLTIVGTQNYEKIEAVPLFIKLKTQKIDQIEGINYTAWKEAYYNLMFEDPRLPDKVERKAILSQPYSMQLGIHLVRLIHALQQGNEVSIGEHEELIAYIQYLKGKPNDVQEEVKVHLHIVLLARSYYKISDQVYALVLDTFKSQRYSLEVEYTISLCQEQLTGKVNEDDLAVARKISLVRSIRWDESTYLDWQISFAALAGEIADIEIQGYWAKSFIEPQDLRERCERWEIQLKKMYATRAGMVSLRQQIKEHDSCNTVLYAQWKQQLETLQDSLKMLAEEADELEKGLKELEKNSKFQSDNSIHQKWRIAFNQLYKHLKRLNEPENETKRLKKSNEEITQFDEQAYQQWKQVLQKLYQCVLNRVQEGKPSEALGAYQTLKTWVLYSVFHNLGIVQLPFSDVLTLGKYCDHYLDRGTLLPDMPFGEPDVDPKKRVAQLAGHFSCLLTTISPISSLINAGALRMMTTDETKFMMIKPIGVYFLRISNRDPGRIVFTCTGGNTHEKWTYHHLLSTVNKQVIRNEEISFEGEKRTIYFYTLSLLQKMLSQFKKWNNKGEIMFDILEGTFLFSDRPLSEILSNEYQEAVKTAYDEFNAPVQIEKNYVSTRVLSHKAATQKALEGQLSKLRRGEREEFQAKDANENSIDENNNNENSRDTNLSMSFGNRR